MNPENLEPAYWTIAAAVTVWLIAQFISVRYRRMATERRDRKYSLLTDPKAKAVAATSYKDRLRTANKRAAGYLVLSIIALPTIPTAVYLFVSGLSHAPAQWLLGIGAVALTFAILVGVFVGVREAILRTVES